MYFMKSISNETDNSLTLAHQLLSKPSNIVFSPLSIHVLLGMIAAGSNGPTRDQIASFVTSTSADDLSAFFSQIVSPALSDGSPLGGPVLSTANGLWVDRTLNLKPAFRDVLRDVYRAASKRVDIINKPKKAIERVNKWGSKKTNGLIKNILPSDALDEPTSSLERKRKRKKEEEAGLILANAVYFKGKWRSSHKFDASLTKERKFYLLDGSSVRAPLMSNPHKYQYFGAFEGFKVVSLPYEHGEDSRRYSMHIYLPDAKDGLPALRERVCSEPGFIDNHLPPWNKRLDKFLIPKFKISFDIEASDVLKGMGLVLPFQDEDSGLTEMVEEMTLKVTKIFHKAFVEVNEEGTEAAAVTAARLQLAATCSRYRIIERFEFVADHPFLFVIREDTEDILLFIGQLLNPLA